MKGKTHSKFTALVLSLAMALTSTVVSVGVGAEEPASGAGGTGGGSSGDKTYVLESKNLTAFAAGAKADGAYEKAGTEDYFTLY